MIEILCVLTILNILLLLLNWKLNNETKETLKEIKRFLEWSEEE